MMYRKLSSQTCLISSNLQSVFSKINKSLRLIGTKSCADPFHEPEVLHEGERLNFDKGTEICIENIKNTKKYAMMFSYLGKEYYGLQRSADVPTIEEELLKALYKAGLISKEHYLDPYEMRYQKASRTDKGVSALRQIVSLFLEKDINTEHTVERINNELCPQIRVMGIKRVTKSFDAKNSCDARLYSYMMPTLAFCPVEELCTENYRLTKKHLSKINHILKKFEGVHNFQNFTSSKEAREKGCMRNINFCRCGQPFVQEGVEFVVIKIKGQSFMLYQIRNMIGLTVAIIRGLANLEALNENFRSEKIRYHKAPGLGLVLDDVMYDTYNWIFGGKGFLQPLLWDECQKNVHHFKTKYIQDNIVKTEIKEKSMMKWLESCYDYSYEAASKKPCRTKLYAAFAHLRKVQKSQQETDKRMVDMVPNR